MPFDYLGATSPNEKGREMSALEKSFQSGSIKTEIKSSKSLAGGITERTKFKCLTFQIFEKVFCR